MFVIAVHPTLRKKLSVFFNLLYITQLNMSLIL